MSTRGPRGYHTTGFWDHEEKKWYIDGDRDHMTESPDIDGKLVKFWRPINRIPSPYEDQP